MTPDFLYLIAYDERHKPEALQRFRKSLQSAMAQTKHVSICVVDCCPVPVKPWLDMNFIVTPIKYVHKVIPGIFNPSKVRNFGVRQLVKSPWFFLSDVDIVYPADYVETLLKAAEADPEIVRISPITIGMTAENREFQRGDAPGNGLVKLDVFEKVNGLPEDMVGYGPEDLCLNFSMARHGKYIREYPSLTVHQWHPPISPRTRTKDNDRLWESIKGKLLAKEPLVINPNGWGKGE